MSVREVQPVQLRYGASYDTERGLGGIFDLSNHNTLGKARVIGLRARYDGEIREGRAYYSQPSLRYFPVQLTGAVYFFEDRNPSTNLTRRFNVDRKGASIQGETKLRDRYVWSYGYRYERARTLDPEPAGILDETFTVAPLTMTLTRETRDEVLDATRGAFLAQAFAYSPSWLGAERPYVRYFGQYFHFLPAAARATRAIHERDHPAEVCVRHRRSSRAGEEGWATRCRPASDSSPAAARRCAAPSRTRLDRLEMHGCPSAEPPCSC